MRNLVVQPMIRIVGALSILWAITAMWAYSHDGSVAEIANAVLSGEKFSSKQLIWIREQLDSGPADFKEASAARGAAVLRMLLLETKLTPENREISVSDYDRISSAVSDALARSPTDSFLWLSAFWLKRLNVQPTADDFKLLRMSYWSGPNEGWIALKRLPLAFGVFETLPTDLVDKTFSDFLGLVRSKFYWEAAGLLGGPGWAIRDQLVTRLLLVDLSDRRGFAKALAARDIPGVSIPGVVEERPFRPF